MADPGAPGAGTQVTFTLDGREVGARPGEMIISAAERAGTYIPRFCYHPRMKPVGMCRMCLVEVSGPRGATLQPACFVAAADGMEVVTTSEKVKKAQDGVLEFLLVNHPLDCPVCDKGGECPLQDQTLAYGPGESRFVEEKRHFAKPIELSELVLLDRERCIQCGRCTRFADEVAGEAQIDFAGRGERVEVATFPEVPFSSYFSGNTVQICPVGALTATPYRFTARPWDLDQVESTCTTCAFGCRAAVQSSANRVTRLLGIDSDPVNQSWLCDKGRFVYESVNGDEKPGGTPKRRRLTEPLVRKAGELVPVGWGEALAAAADGLTAARRAGGPEAVAFIGGARCTTEGAYAWAKLAKGVLGTDSVDAQLGDGLPPELVLGLPRATIDEACRARTVVLLTGDVREELPVLFLRLRGAVLEGGTKIVELSQQPSSLTPYAEVSLRLRPGDTASLVRALVAEERTPREAVAGLPAHPDGAAVSPEDLARARALVGGDGGTPRGEGIVVLLGRLSLAEHEALIADAARVLAAELPGAKFLPALRRGNVQGALDMGLAPGLLPGRVTLADGAEWFRAAWGAVPESRGLDTAGILSSLAGQGPESAARALVLIGADVLSDFPDANTARGALQKADFVLVVGGHTADALDHADVFLPAAVAHERPGTTVNVEGRVSRLGQKLVAPGLAWPDWMIAAELGFTLGADLGAGSSSDLWDEIERLAPAYAGLTAAVLEREGASDGFVVPIGRGVVARTVSPIDPMATPGVQAVERQGAPPRVGLAELPEVDDESHPSGPERAPGPTPPPVVGVPDRAGEPPHVPAVDSYSLRLVAPRHLYDGGNAVSGSPSLLPLVPRSSLRANAYDLDRVGVTTGDRVRVRSSRGSIVLLVVVDPSVVRGAAVVGFNLPSSQGPGAGEELPNAVGALIDTREMVTDIRLESL